MKFDINNYKGKYVMHCKTKREAEEFCAYLRGHGMFHKASIVFSWYKENTCFNFNTGTHSEKDWYEKEGFTILEWSDFTTEFTKADLKNGMVVEYDNGWRRLVLGKNLVSNDGNASLSSFNEDLLSVGDITINKVYESTALRLDDIFDDDHLTLIWERKAKPEPVEMTLAEVCKALGKEIKIVKE